MSMRRTLVSLLAATTAAVTAFTLAPAAHGQAPGQAKPAKKIVVTDRRGEARPDISSLRARQAGATVRLSIRVRRVDPDDSLTLYVRNAASGPKPQLALVTGLNTDGGGYDIWRTRGWKVQYGKPTPTSGVECGDKVRIKRWGRTGARLAITLGEDCLGDAGKVRFAVRAERSDANGDRVDVDWLTARKRLTPPVRAAS